MIVDKLLDDCAVSMSSKLESLDKELGKVRTGRASVAILDGIRVDYYGSSTPINQMASVSTPDARTVMIAPFEKKVIPDIERAIQIADIGIQPTNNGTTIRLPVPPLNEQRRKEIAKSIKKLGEDYKVGVRKIRQDANQTVKRLEKSKEINEDESKRVLKKVQDETDKSIKLIDERVNRKQEEVLNF